MKQGNWVPMDKTLVKTLSNINRPFSHIEAMFSYSVDRDNGKEGTLRGYAKLWGWSVGRVKRFVECLRNTSGTVVERKGNGSGTAIRFVDGSLKGLAEQLRNGRGTVAERKRVATIYPNPNPEPNPKKKGFSSDSNEVRLSQLLLSKILLRNPEHKQPDIQTWAKEIDYMIRLDNREPQKIANLINWVQEDDFEQNNVLSTSKLRKRYDALFLKMGGGVKYDPQAAKEQALLGATR